MQAFIYRHGQSQAGSNKQQTGIERARQKSTQINRRGRRSAYNCDSGDSDCVIVLRCERD